jgi:hypothetical protein
MFTELKNKHKMHQLNESAATIDLLDNDSTKSNLNLKSPEYFNIYNNKHKMQQLNESAATIDLLDNDSTKSNLNLISPEYNNINNNHEIDTNTNINNNNNNSNLKKKFIITTSENEICDGSTKKKIRYTLDISKTKKDKIDSNKKKGVLLLNNLI